MTKNKKKMPKTKTTRKISVLKKGPVLTVKSKKVKTQTTSSNRKPQKSSILVAIKRLFRLLYK